MRILMKRPFLLGLGVLLLAPFLAGCGGEGDGAGNADAAKVIGVSPDAPEYGTASSDMMSDMHGGSMPGAKKKDDATKKK